MALAPWNVRAGGEIHTDEEQEKRRQSREEGCTFGSPNWECSEKEKAVGKGLEKVGARDWCKAHNVRLVFTNPEGIEGE